jgi:Methyltransferase domain
MRFYNALWRLFSKRIPRFSNFSANPTDEIRSANRGRAADIFFSIEEDTVHKWLHYLPIYDELFAPFVGSNVRFLEIGVSRGGSLRMWRKFLGPDALIYGVDINPDCAVFDGKAAQVRIGSQDDPSFLASVVDEMGGVDVVLDDGSHIASHQRASFEVLFPLLSDGGLYVIEDTHSAYWPHMEGGLRRPGTAIEYLKGKIDEIHRHYYERGRNTPETMSDIESLQFFDSICVVKKRNQTPRRHVVVSPRARTK